METRMLGSPATGRHHIELNNDMVRTMEVMVEGKITQLSPSTKIMETVLTQIMVMRMIIINLKIHKIGEEIKVKERIDDDQEIGVIKLKI